MGEVDEYQAEFQLFRDTSSQLFTLAELIELIDRTNEEGCSGGLALGYNQVNAQTLSPPRLRHFTTITSDFYRHLFEHFEHVFEKCVRAGEEHVMKGRQP